MSPIAIVGVAARLPSGSHAQTDLDFDSFFDFLLHGREAYQQIPPSRLNLKYIRGQAVGQILTDTGAFLKDLDSFDYMEFGITTKDAKFMSIGTRQLIEATFLSLCDSGIDYRGKNVGCYMSAVAHDIISVSGHDDTEINGSFAHVPAMVANRVSYHLDLRGPSVPIDTACSSSLYATHLAVQALRNGECEAAVVGGAQINHRFSEWLTYSQGGILSSDGKCKPFDISADGFGRGEGVVAIVLKPLETAIRDGDHVYGTILGTGVNSSGSLVPANAPAASAQREAMLRAFRASGRSPQDVDFIELHATGTAQGDPTEANWVGEEFKRDNEILIGSVKGNIGHLEITAFLASLCKVCGILKTGLIPPSVNLSRPNPIIRWSQYRLRVPVDPEPLTVRSSNGQPLIAMTSSGIGGANGHAVIEGPPARATLAVFWSEEAEVPTLLVAGALSPRATSEIGDELCGIARSSTQKIALARIFGRRVRSMTWRSFAVLGSHKSSDITKPVLAPKVRPPIVFVFSGQGSQHFQMGKDLYKACIPFRKSILALDKVYASVVGSSLIESTGLFSADFTGATDALGDPWPMSIVLPALTMLQLALVDTLAVVGVLPDIVIGHSAGETAVLSASGAASKSAALELAIARGRALSLVEEAGGTMAAVNCSAEDAQQIIDEVNVKLGTDVLTIGCFNAPDAVTLSGTESHIDLAVAKASAAGIFARKLKTRVPVHSTIMELCHASFEKLVADVFSRHDVSPPTVTVYSTVTGKIFDRAFDTAYYWDGTLGAVQFKDAIHTLLNKNKSATFIEIGPHPVLAAYLQTIGQHHNNITITCPLRRLRTLEPGIETFEFVTSLGKVVTAGHGVVNFDVLYGSATTYTGSLPRYPFALRSVPWSVATPEIVRQRQQRSGPMNYPQLQINAHTHPGLADHVIQGEPIMPAAGFIEMALEFGAKEIYNAQFHSVLSLSSRRPAPVLVRLDGAKWSVRSATSIDYEKVWPIDYDRLHARGFLTLEAIQDRGVAPMDLDVIRKRLRSVDVNSFYFSLASFANYGRMYCRVRQCYLGTSRGGAAEALVEIRARDNDIPNFEDYVFHPAILDAAIQVLVHPGMTGNYDKSQFHLPSKIAAFRLCPSFEDNPFPATVFSHVTLVRWTPGTVTYNCTIADPQGTPIATIEGIEIELHGHRKKPVEKRYEVVYRPIELSLPKYEGPQLTTTHVDVHDDLCRGDQNDQDVLGLVNCGLEVHSHGHNGRLDEESGTTSKDPINAVQLLIPYKRTEEMRIQQILSQHNTLVSLTILFVADDGLNGDAALGFTRALRKEFPGWSIRLAVFDSSWTVPQREHAAPFLLSSVAEDLEFCVNANGTVIVPRIELAKAPALKAPLDTKQPWRLENGAVIQTSVPQASGEFAVVRVRSIAYRQGNVWTYVGDVSSTSQQVMGIASGPFRSHVEAHVESIVNLPSDTLQVQAGGPTIGPSILALTLVSLLLGPLLPRRFRGLDVLVFEDNDQLRSQIHVICARMEMNVLSTADLTGSELERCYLHPPSIVFSGTQDSVKISTIGQISASDARVLLWNHSEEGLVSVASRTPWLVGEAIRHALAYHPLSTVEYTSLEELVGNVPDHIVTQSLDLFESSKSYLLVGGVGSLGLHIALWMYQNGARHIILTSRSGVYGLERRRDYIAQWILAHLQARGDLIIDVTEADATSLKDMDALVQGLRRPLGGCMLLTMILSDSTFVSHTEESFERAFPAKIQGFQVLEQVIDLQKLDFLVTFSSVAALFGSPGQTNYAAANTALAGLTRKYKNAFSIVAPLILDSSVLMNDGQYAPRLRHITNWGMTARELCEYIGDGIKRLREGRVWQCVPDLNWLAVRDSLGPSTMFNHLIAKDAEIPEGGDANDDSVTQIVCRVLDLKENEVSIDVPLTKYGLDSLSAVALSFALRPIVPITQVQLLADVTIKDIESKAVAPEFDAPPRQDI